MFVVYDENMNEKELPNGVWPLDIFIPSIQRLRTTDSIEGRDGILTLGVKDENRPPIELTLRLEASDTRDYRLLRDEVFSFFNDHDFLYISEAYQRGKRIKGVVLNPFIPERINQRISSTQVFLETVDLPYFESIGTTQDIQRNGISADDELWGYSMGLLVEDDSLIYTHDVAGIEQFAIYNAGNVPIHPFQQDLNIKISNVIGSTSFLELRNDTTGSAFRVIEAVSTSQSIELDGPNITSNGLQFLRKTNKQFIELAPGWNYFTLTGATSAKVEFDFRFYYE